MSMASFFALFFNMYKGIKSCVSFSGNQSSFFPCLRGVRQGENLSPVLFALFFNDLESFMHSKNCSDVNLEINSDNLYIYLRLFVLLYADLFVLRFYGPVNPMGSCRARSVYLTTRLLGRLSPLSG